MMISKLCSLCFTSTTDYSKNLQTLLSLIDACEEESLIVAHEVALTGFDYKNLNKAIEFSTKAIVALKEASKNKIIILTMFDKKDGEIYNFVRVFYNHDMVHERAKSKLFHLGCENNYMQEGSDDACTIINVAGTKIALLICFELRFKELWKKIEGADIVAIPSWWGVLRSEHFLTLTKALAIINQTYVVVSDAKNIECTQMSSIITPDGNVHLNGDKSCLKFEYKKKEISLIRRYIDVGIK